MRNLITDIDGLRVGHAHDATLASGVTAIIIDTENVASAVTRGGAPGSRDTTLLEPEMTAQGVNAVILSGGSLYGIDAAGGVCNFLRGTGLGLRIGPVIIPVAVQAITFDLINGGNKDWGRMPPYWDLGWQAAERATDGDFALGTVGGGYGTTTATMKGGVGSASMVTASGFRVAAIAVVNSVGTVTIGDGPHFWAASVEVGNEFGGLGMPVHLTPTDLALRMKGARQPATTIGLVATDGILTKPQAKRLAIMADDGLARAVRPAHAPMDGDTVFAVATQKRPLTDPLPDITEIGMAAGDCLARAIARGVFEATALPFHGAMPAWRDKFGKRS
jgi:L-aminopeptidase/D-esterase-like protein